MKQGETGAKEVLFGVSLSDLARVHAAERAGVPVEERLAELGLSRAGFARAEQAWLERITMSLRDDPALFVAYDEALAEALANDGPRLLPYEEDLAAWVSLEGSLQRALDPAEVARKTGLSLAEVARLHGGWARKITEDAKVAEDAARLRAEEPAPLVEVRREPRARRASVDRPHSELASVEPALLGVAGGAGEAGRQALPVVPPAASAPVPTAAVLSAPSVPLAPAPPAPVPLHAVPEPDRRASTPMSSETGAIDLGALMKGPLPFDPRVAPSVAGPAGPSGGQGAPAPRTPAFTGTAAVDLSQLRPGVPFGPGGTPVASGATPPAPPPPAPPPAHSMHSSPAAATSYTGTAEVDVRAILGSGRPLPFQGNAAPAPPVPPPAPPPPQAAAGPAPATPPATPPDKPRPFDSGTTDVDPELIARVLAKGAPPFRK